MAHPYKNTPLFAAKGGGTTKVCLPKSKVARMSPEEKKKVIRAKESAGRSGKRERSQRSEVSSARKPGATLKDWFEKENWINVKTGEECGAPTKMVDKKSLACNKPRKTPSHKTKSHIVKACEGGKEKIIRFGQQGVKTAGKPKEGESAKQKARRKSFKARHAKNIKKGKMSAAYWADKVKW